MFKNTLAFLLPAFLSTLPVMGESVTYSTPYSFTYSLADALGDTSSGTAVKPLTRNASIDPLAVAAFDSSLGTLTGVTIMLEIAVYSGQFTLNSSFDTPNSSFLQLWSFGAGYVLSPSTSVSGSFVVYDFIEASDGTAYRVDTGANNLGVFSASDTKTQTLALGSYNTMTKDGELLFRLYLSGDITIVENDPLFQYLSAEGEATVSGSLAVIYEYDAVPEPGNVMLLLVGVLPLARRFYVRRCGTRS